MNMQNPQRLVFCVLIGGGLLHGCATQPQPQQSPPSLGSTYRSVGPVTDAEDQEPVLLQDGKKLWATSYLWNKPPELIVEAWVSAEPQTEGKCVLIEFWATWCPPCRQSISLLNKLHERFRDRLVVIGLAEEPAQTIRAFAQPQVQYFSAIDTQARMKNEMAVHGIPHVIILEPDGYVVWEGFPYQEGYELTEAVVESILEIAFQTEP